MSRSPLAVLWLTVFVDLLGFGMVLPLLAFYGTHFHASPEQMAFMSGMYSAGQLVLAPVWGLLSDRWGRRPTLLLSLAGISMAWVIFATAGSYRVLLLGRILSGACGANVAIAYAWVADVTTTDTRTQGMGVIGTAFALGFVLGPALGAWAGTPNLMVPPFIAAALSLVALLLAWMWLVEPGHSPAARSRSWSDPTLLRWLAAFLLLMIAYASAEVILPYRLADAPFIFGRLGGGLIFTFIGVTAVLAQGAIAPWAVRRFGDAPVVLGGALVFTAGLAGMPSTLSLAPLLVACALMGVGHGCCYPALLGMMSARVPEDAQGILQGATQSVASLGRLVGPVGSGVLYAHLGTSAPWLAAAACTAATAVLATRRR